MLSSFYHDPAVDAWIHEGNTLHIALKAKTGSAQRVELLYGDPFDWHRTQPDGPFVWSGEQNPCSPLSLIASSREFDYYAIDITLPTKRVKYAFLIDDRYLLGSLVYVDTWEHPEKKVVLGNYFNHAYLLPTNDFHAPTWMKSTLWYSIFPDRFANHHNTYPGLHDWHDESPRNDQFYGGNLQGITAKLDYLQSMGFNGIYLTPIFKSPSAHKYDTLDYLMIDPLFGTLEDLQALTRAAHQRGIRVVLDLVFNHVSYQHPFFQDVIEKGKDSPYYSAFFLKDEAVNIEALHQFRMDHPDEINRHIPYETFAFSYRMPKINCDHPLIQAYFQKVVGYWLEEGDVDGFRLDVANEISHDFWRVIRKTIHAKNPSACLIGESWDVSTAFLQGDQWDSVMNYPLTTLLTEFFHPSSQGNPLAFQDALIHLFFAYPNKPRSVLYNLLGSHDLPRILTVFEGHLASVKQAFIMMYALPGMPSVYYGDEVGLTGGKDPLNRRPMPWDETKQHQELKSFFCTLNHLYHTLQAFQSLAFRFLSQDDALFVMQKDEVFFLFNRKDTSCQFEHKIFEGSVYNHWTKQVESCAGSMVIPGYGFGIYAKQ